MTTHRERTLGQARADLVALPALVEELAKLVSDRHHDVSGYRGKVIGSPAPLQLPIVHLVDTRHKPDWHGRDPRTERIADRYGITPALETWVRALADDLVEQHGPSGFPDLTEQATVRSEAAVLLEHWAWICDQPWALELAQDVTTMANQVRAGLGIRPEPTYRCPECSNRAYMQPGGILACTEVPDHDIVVRDLDQQMRRRPALPTKDICEEFGVEPGTLRVWKHRRKITPAPSGTLRDHWFPWDVFCLLNPDIAEAFEARDETRTG